MALGCGTAQIGGLSATTGDTDYDSTNKLRFQIEQTSHPMTFPADNGKVDVSFRITIANELPSPITIRRLTLQSMGGGVFRLETSSRKYNATIAPHASESFKFWAPAIATDLTQGTRAPLVVRTTVDGMEGENRIHEVFNRRVNDEVSIGIGSIH